MSPRPRWIGRLRGDTGDAPPAVYLQREFALSAAPEAARLLITARGIFDAWINGERVGEDVLAPGWTDYRKRVDFLNYDVTHLLRAGGNVIQVALGDGWFSGILSEPQFGLRYGTDPSLFAELVMHDGHRETRVVTDASWQAASGPIRENALYHTIRNAPEERGRRTGGIEWRNHFTPKVRERFAEKFGQTLIDAGYEKDLAWAGAPSSTRSSAGL